MVFARRTSYIGCVMMMSYTMANMATAQQYQLRLFFSEEEIGAAPPAIPTVNGSPTNPLFPGRTLASPSSSVPTMYFNGRAYIWAVANNPVGQGARWGRISLDIVIQGPAIIAGGGMIEVGDTSQNRRWFTSSDFYQTDPPPAGAVADFDIFDPLGNGGVRAPVLDDGWNDGNAVLVGYLDFISNGGTSNVFLRAGQSGIVRIGGSAATDEVYFGWGDDFVRGNCQCSSALPDLVIEEPPNDCLVASDGLSEREIVPTPVSSDAQATFNWSLGEYNDFRYHLITSGVGGVPVANIHGPAYRGQNGPVLHSLEPVVDTPNEFEGSLALTDEEVRLLLSGLCYVNVDSDSHPTGELRAQLFSSKQEPPQPPFTIPSMNVVSGAMQGPSVGAVSSATGEYQLDTIDLVIPGRGIDVVLSRSYRSRYSGNSLTFGWDFSYGMRIEPLCHLNSETNMPRGVFLVSGRGRRDFFAKRANGKYGCDNWVVEGEESGNGLWFTFVFPDGGYWRFYGIDSSTPATHQGKLERIVDRNANTLVCAYDANGRLTTITDTLNRNIAFGYDAQSRLSTVTDFAGRQVAYGYSPGGNLISVRTPLVTGTSTGNDFPVGKVTRYAYDTSQQLTSIMDPRGNVVLLNIYSTATNPNDPSYLRVVRQLLGANDDIIDYSYFQTVPDETANNSAVERVIVNDRVGNVSEYFYDGYHRLVMQRDYTGRANPDVTTTDVSNRPTSKLRATDPDYYETRYEYNADAMVTSILDPNGNQVVNQYELDINPAAPRRSRGNLRATTRIAGPLGGDQTQIGASFAYEPSHNFVLTATDARGATTTHQYDAAGNRIQTTHRLGSIVESWQYNQYGQVITHTLPPVFIDASPYSRLDSFSYYGAGPQTGYLATTTVDLGGENLVTNYEYDAVGNLIRQIDPRGNDTLFTVNQLNQVVRTLSRPVEVSPGNFVRYQNDTFYDANDNIVRTDHYNVTETGSPDPSNPVLTSMFEYDILNRLTRSTQERDAAHDLVTDYQYDANGNRTLTRYGQATSGDDPNNVVQTLYDERDLVFQTIRAPGSPLQSSTQLDYDGNGNTSHVREGLESAPRVSVMAYDGYDRLVASQDAMGNISGTHYDANGNVTQAELFGEIPDVPGDAGNVLLSETSNTYDAMDRLTQSDDEHFDTSNGTPLGDGQSSSYVAYSNTSQVLLTVDDNNHATTYEYDTALRLKRTTDAKTNMVEYAYDANSNPLTVTETEKSDLGNPPQTFVTTYVYDSLDRTITTVDNVGNAMDYFYDSRDNNTLVVDALSNETRYVYDGASRLVRTIRDMNGNGANGDLADIVNDQAWDDSSRLTSQIDDNGNATSYAYDSLNRRIATQFADGTINTTTYDVHDNAIGMTNARGTVTTCAYDALNRRTGCSYTPGPGVNADTTAEFFAYDGLSRLIRAGNDLSYVERNYDSLGGVLSEAVDLDAPYDGVGAPTLSSLFDGVGNRTFCQYPGGREITTEFDGLNRPSVIREGATHIADYKYIGPGRVERREYPNGGGASAVCIDYSYDGARRTTRTRHVKDPTGAGIVLDDRTFAWDPMYNKTARTDMRPGGAAHAYGYDPAYRMTQSVKTPGGGSPEPIDYEMDGVGNRTHVTGGSDEGDYTLSAGADSAMNQYSRTPFDTRSYDQSGNLIVFGGCLVGDANNDGNVDNFDIDPFVNILVGMDPPNCEADANQDGHVDNFDIDPFVNILVGGPQPSVGYAAVFDVHNRMTRLNDLAHGLQAIYRYDALGRRVEKFVATGAGTQTTRMYYDGWREIEEQDEAGATLATYIFGNYIDETLQMQRGADKHYYLSDDMFNVTAVTDAAGDVAERYDYEDYGKPQIMDPSGAPRESSALGNCVLFTGRRCDPESGLYYYRTRYHDPRAGRFAERDKIGVWGDRSSAGNAFSLGSHRPMSQCDPFGLSSSDTSATDEPSWLARMGGNLVDAGAQFTIYPLADTITTSILAAKGGYHLEDVPYYSAGAQATQAGILRGDSNPTRNTYVGVAKSIVLLHYYDLYVEYDKGQMSIEELRDRLEKMAASQVFSVLVSSASARTSGRGWTGRSQLPKDANLLKSAESLDREGYSRAGRSLAKHAGRAGSKLPKPKGNTLAKNAQALVLLKDILRNKVNEVSRYHPKFGNIIEVFDKNGIGARFNLEGSFLHFVEGARMNLPGPISRGASAALPVGTWIAIHEDDK